MHVLRRVAHEMKKVKNQAIFSIGKRKHLSYMEF